MTSGDPPPDTERRQPQHPLHRLVGIVDERAADGRATCDVEPMAGESAPTSFALTTAVDILLVRAAATTVTPPHEEMNGTAELNVTYTRPAVGVCQVEAHVVGRSSNMRVLEFTVADAEGVFTFGRSTYAVRQRSPR